MANVVQLSQQFDRFKDADKDGSPSLYSGFSARLNVLIDQTGLSVKQHGRGAWLAEVAKVTRAATSDWLTKDKIPNDKTFDALVNFLLSHVPGKHSVNRIKSWLMFGAEVVSDPFHAAFPDHLKTFVPLAATLIAEVAKQEGLDVTQYNLQPVLRETVAMLGGFNLSDRADIEPAHLTIIAQYLRLYPR